MTTKTTRMFLWLVAMAFGVLGATEPATEDDKVERIFVIRRNLEGPLNGPPVNVGVLSHSALLLKTAHKYYTLEYMDDSKVHLTETTPEMIKEYPNEKWAHIKAAGRFDEEEKLLDWARQLSGAAVEPLHTPEELKSMMQELVGDYSVWRKEHCHTAQERLRRKLGLKVD